MPRIFTKPSVLQHPRWRFTMVMSFAGAVYGAVLTYRLLNVQADVISDVVKTTAILFVTLGVISYFWWSVITPKYGSIKGGAAAGFFTAITAIPMPTFFGALKSNLGSYDSLLLTLQSAAHYSISTFSLAEYLAIPPSIAVGIWAAWPSNS